MRRGFSTPGGLEGVRGDFDSVFAALLIKFELRAILFEGFANAYFEIWIEADRIFCANHYAVVLICLSLSAHLSCGGIQFSTNCSDKRPLCCSIYWRQLQQMLPIIALTRLQSKNLNLKLTAYFCPQNLRNRALSIFVKFSFRKTNNFTKGCLANRFYIFTATAVVTAIGKL